MTELNLQPSESHMDKNLTTTVDCHDLENDSHNLIETPNISYPSPATNYNTATLNMNNLQELFWLV